MSLSPPPFSLDATEPEFVRLPTLEEKFRSELDAKADCSPEKHSAVELERARQTSLPPLTRKDGVIMRSFVIMPGPGNFTLLRPLRDERSFKTPELKPIPLNRKLFAAPRTGFSATFGVPIAANTPKEIKGLFQPISPIERESDGYSSSSSSSSDDLASQASTPKCDSDYSPSFSESESDSESDSDKDFKPPQVRRKRKGRGKLQLPEYFPPENEKRKSQPAKRYKSEFNTKLSPDDESKKDAQTDIFLPGYRYNRRVRQKSTGRLRRQTVGERAPV